MELIELEYGGNVDSLLEGKYKRPLYDKFVEAYEVNNLEVDGSDNSGIAKEIAGELGIGTGDSGENSGRKGPNNSGGRKGVVLRKRSSGDQNRSVDSVSGPSGGATEDGGRTEEAGGEGEKAQGNAAEFPSWVSKARSLKQAGPQA